MSGKLIHLSEDLIGPLEQIQEERCDKTVASTARALLRQALKNRGLYDVESLNNCEDRSEEKPS